MRREEYDRVTAHSYTEGTEVKSESTDGDGHGEQSPSILDPVRARREGSRGIPSTSTRSRFAKLFEQGESNRDTWLLQSSADI